VTPARSAYPGALLDDDVFADQWWFVRIYTRGFDGGDPLIGDLLPPIIAEARARGIRRWFYIRYLDEGGPHVRLRVLGRRPVLDHLQRVHHELEADLGDLLSARPAEHCFIAPVDRRAYEGRSATGVRASIYEPEVAKYGGPVGLGLAEELFEFSSDLGLWACGRFGKGHDRAGLAALLLADGVAALVDGPHSRVPSRQRIDADAYWDRHLHWWTAELGSKGPAARSSMRERVDERRERVGDSMERVSALPGVDAWRRRWRTAVDAYLHRAQAVGVERSPQHLTFHHGHMMLNRLGFLPREEAVLGVYARVWADGG